MMSKSSKSATKAQKPESKRTSLTMTTVEEAMFENRAFALGFTTIQEYLKHLGRRDYENNNSSIFTYQDLDIVEKLEQALLDGKREEINAAMNNLSQWISSNTKEKVE